MTPTEEKFGAEDAPLVPSPRRVRLAALAMAVAGTAVVSGCGYGIQDLPVGRSAGAGAFDVDVHLSSADGIVLGADVRYGQQIVGRVAALNTATTGANLQVSLQRELEVPSNVLVSVEIASALGSPYLRLVTPADAASDRSSDGDVITVGNTDLGPRVETMLASLGNVVSGSGMDQLADGRRRTEHRFHGAIRSGAVARRYCHRPHDTGDRQTDRVRRGNDTRR